MAMTKTSGLYLHGIFLNFILRSLDIIRNLWFVI